MKRTRDKFAVAYDSNSKNIYVYGGGDLFGRLNACEKYNVV